MTVKFLHGTVQAAQDEMHYYQMLMAGMHAAIAAGEFDGFASDFRRDYLGQ